MAATTTSLLSLKPSFTKTHFSFSTSICFKQQSRPNNLRLCLRPQCTVSSVQVEEQPTDAVISPQEELKKEEEEEVKKRKVYVANLPWSYTDNDIEKLFIEFGQVKDISVIKHQNGKSRGYAFLRMGSTEEALAAIQKLNATDVMGRTIKVEFANNFTKPPRPSPTPKVPKDDADKVKDANKVYVSNLAFKARSTHLREFFAPYNPTSARVVFQQNNGKSAGYGFVGFVTNEEAEKAVAELDGKDLMERPVRLKISERVEKKPENSSEESQESTTESENSSEETQQNTTESENPSVETQES